MTGYLSGKSMKKIVIFGNSGAGKSTLAKKLQQKYNLNYLDLDLLAWSNSSIPTRKPFAESTEEINDFLSNVNEWVIEGCYADLLRHVIKEAGELIFLNPGTDVCISHCRNRPWEPHKYASKEEQDKNLEMLIDWVKQYETRNDEFSLKAHIALYELFKKRKTIVKDGENYQF